MRHAIIDGEEFVFGSAGGFNHDAAADSIRELAAGVTHVHKDGFMTKGFTAESQARRDAYDAAVAGAALGASTSELRNRSTIRLYDRLGSGLLLQDGTKNQL